MKVKKAKLFLMMLLLSGFRNTFAFGADDIAGHWAEKTIIEWQKEGKINGYEDNTFRPDAPITRAEFVHLLNNMITTEQNVSVSFNDVSEKDWFYKDVIKAAGNHIVAGFEDNTFRPNEMITRAQAALIIKNVLQLPDSTNSISILDDNDIPEWAKNAVYAMVNTGYLSGYEDGSFCANKSMTRAEAISMLSRVDKNIQNTNEIPQDNTNEIPQNTNIENHSENAKTVWEKGDSHSSYQSNKKKDEEKKPENEPEIIITKDNVADFYGKILQDKVKIVLDYEDIELFDMTLNGAVEVVLNDINMQTNTTPTLLLKGSTVINDMTSSIPIVIKSENNTIETLTITETTTISDTFITNLKCYKNTVSEKEKNPLSIYLEGNVHSNIIIPEFTVVENIYLSDNAQSHITNKGELKEIISFSQCSGTMVTNYGTIDSIIALDTETITAQNAVVEPAIIQNITILSGPSQVHYKEGDNFSLSNISLLLQYQNDITQIVDKIEDFNFYHIQTIPAHNARLTAKEDNKPIKIYGDNVSINGDLLEIDYTPNIEEKPNVEEKVNTDPLVEWIQNCKSLLENTTISETGNEIDFGKYYISENDFYLFEKQIEQAEQLLLKQDITQNKIEQQCDVLQLALQEFETKRIFQMTVQPPILSVSNTEPKYNAEDVTFTIEKKDNTKYYYTLDGSEPTTESIEYTETVLLPPQETTSITIKAIAVENEVFSSVSEITLVYVIPVEKISFSDLEAPFINKQASAITLEDETECIIKEFYWKNGEENADIFKAETSYTAEIILKANENYIFESPILENIPEDKIENVIIENIDTNNLHISIVFKATPPYPTEEMALKELEKLYRLSIFADSSEIDEEEYCMKVVSEYAQEQMSEYWIVNFEPYFFNFFGSSSALSGKFTVSSTIDSSISVTNENNVDVTIIAESKEEIE